MLLSISTDFDRDVATVRVAGEVDVSNADDLRAAIDAAIGREGVTSVAVDLADVAYIDSTGIGVLVGAAHKAKDARCGFSAVDPQANVARILGLLGVDEVIDIQTNGAGVRSAGVSGD